MATDEECLEIARNLRQNATKYPKMNLVLNLAFSDKSLKPEGSMEWTVTSYEAAIRLANLLEHGVRPTCKRKWNVSHEWYSCGSCGAVLTDSMYKYCPYCGSEFDSEPKEG